MTTEAPPTTVASLLSLYERRGAHTYGEDVTQTVHALQCAALARDVGASDAMIAAALLHDVGHLLTAPDDTEDDEHEAIGARLLAPLFGPKVAGPVALHVTAKRWRCTVDPSYRASLSAASIASLALQGGLLDEAAARRFEAHPSHADAIVLREWDDAAKDPDAPVGSLADHVELLDRLTVRSAATDR